jgi:acyl-CoA dehydrogenase
MTIPQSGMPHSKPARGATSPRDFLYPQAFSASHPMGATPAYLADPSILKLVQFFEAKGLLALKEEDRREQWYEDWLTYQAAHRVYASVLSPKRYSAHGDQFDLPRLARLLEVFGYFSPAHGYSLQVTFLGLFSILMGSNSAVKKEAVAAVEAGGLLGFGISEREHGSDLLGNEFGVTQTAPGRLVANGKKYYIGNANCAAIISTLARRLDPRSERGTRRAPFALIALRPNQSGAIRNVEKIRTIGIRSAFVGELEVRDHELPENDVIANGRAAWDAVLGTVTLGKFLLGFGSIGICEHAFEEAASHLRRRLLYGKPAMVMPHIRSTMAQAYIRLSAMKLYAYRALDYVHAASASDRRYLLFCAVQKAKVSTEGVKVLSLLSECVGAKGFEADTYFEMALRDAQLIPGLEGSTHINLEIVQQFIPQYFRRSKRNFCDPPSLTASRPVVAENPYLMEARTGSINTIEFARYLTAYQPLLSDANARLFAKQAKMFATLLRDGRLMRAGVDDTQIGFALARCAATIAYAQLIAENVRRANVPRQIIASMFHLLVSDFTTSALALASLPHVQALADMPIHRLLVVPAAAGLEWDLVSSAVASPTVMPAV